MKKADIGLLVLFAGCAAAIVVFGVPGIIPYSDERLGTLIMGVVPRFAASLFLLALMILRGDRSSLRPAWRLSHLLWSLPCFLVAVVNFPFTAMIGGKAAVDRPDLIWLFLLDCAGIALLEELFFRALLLPLLSESIRARHRLFFSVVIGAAIFALSHLVNLLYGAGIGPTMLQVGYTFLLGCMFGAMFFVTKNVWLCVAVHFVFDVGGTLIPTLGSGVFQDRVFWILTIVAGVLCAVHIIVTLVFLDRSDRPKPLPHDDKP